MNKLERIVYDAVKSKPWLKLLIRNAYQGFFDLLPTPNEFLIAPLSLKEGYFYGFHDLVPFSDDDSKVLANKLFFDLRMPKKDDSIDVGFFDFRDGKLGEFHKVGESNSWNYHKGCRLQWLDEIRVIYNTALSGNMTSIIACTESRSVKRINYPIDSVSRCGRYATSYSYERLEKYMPGYGYAHHDDDSYLDEKTPKNTGLFLVDLTSGDRTLLVSLAELSSNSDYEQNSVDSYHYVTHSLFSPDGKYISFFHRWVGHDTRKRFTRLVIFDVEANVYSVAPTGYMVSHYVWNEQNEIIAYCNFNNVDSHVIISVPDFSNSYRVAYPALNSDGHQSFIKNNEFITDTYADKRRMARLFRVNTSDNTIQLLASIFSPGKYQTKVPHKHIACDLHPRVSKSGKYLCFDTVKTGRRSLAVLPISE